MNPTAPITIKGAVSPIARESAKIVPVRIPGKAMGKICSLMICHLLAPRAKPACRRLSGTARSDSRVVMIIIGRINKLKVKAPASTLRPLVIGSNTRTKISKPSKP